MNLTKRKIKEYISILENNEMKSNNIPFSLSISHVQSLSDLTSAIL